MDDKDDSRTAGSGYSRRDVLKRGAVAGGALVWAVPAIQLISMTSASAESPSSPPAGAQPAGSPSITQGGVAVSGGSPVAPQASGSDSSLAYTGFPVAPVVAGGAGLVAAGLAAGAVARKRAVDGSTQQDGIAPA